MTNWRVPFNRPSRIDGDVEAVLSALAGGHISGDGPFTAKCHTLLQTALGVRKALLTTSCTHGLEIAALLLDIRPGDEVIVPSFTFVSTAKAFVSRGARPVFVDIRRDTLNLDETHLEASITDRTKAIVVVHYAGVGCEMDTIMSVARTHNIAVVEDNAHGLFAEYRGQMLGTFGDVAALSFHETKNFTCGEGGAVLLNRDDFINRAEIVREKGTDRSRFFRGQVDKYGWVDVGSSYLPSDILAALLLPQLEGRSEIQGRRQRIWSRYYEALGEWAARHDVLLPYVPPHVTQAFHMFYLLMPTQHQRDALIESLKQQRILATFHYLPLHASAFGRQFSQPRLGCPVSDEISGRIVRLPFFTTMSDAEQDDVIAAIHQFAG